MTARDELFYLASRGGSRCGLCENCGYVTSKIDAFAHELAERIRKEATEWDGWPDHINSMNIAANLIDPEVDSA